MLRLGVNIDHVATLRQARYRGLDRGEPCPVDAVRQAEAAGAHGITAHLREDRRHILDRDIWAIRDAVQTRLNFEMATAPEMIDIALRLKPEAVCLVPESAANRFGETFGLLRFDPPYKSAPLVIQSLTHADYREKPAVRWLLECIRSAAIGMGRQTFD